MHVLLYNYINQDFPVVFVFPLSQPFGRGIAMVLVPAVHSGDSMVFVYSRTNLHVAAPAAVLEGHSDAVTDLQWRRHRGGIVAALTNEGIPVHEFL